MKNFSVLTTEREARHGVLLSLGPWVMGQLYSVYCRRLEYMVPAPSSHSHKPHILHDSSRQSRHSDILSDRLWGPLRAITQREPLMIFLSLFISRFQSNRNAPTAATYLADGDGGGRMGHSALFFPLQKLKCPLPTHLMPPTN